MNCKLRSPTHLLLLIVCTLLSRSANVIGRDSSNGPIAANELNPSCQAPGAGKPKCCRHQSTGPEGLQWEESNCFRAAVYEHYRNDSFRDQDWRKMVEINIGDFAEAAREAASNGASIIVFPEDGVLIGSREFIEPGLPELPDPEKLNYTNNNPCQQAHAFQGDPFEAVRQLSCMARDNKLYVAANLGTKETCQHTGQKLPDGRLCPKSNLFAYNTNLVFSPNGTLLKRYRKANLFVEIFDTSPGLELVYFDTPFGRMGIFTCFDMIFMKPAVQLVEKFHVDTILFPTLWYDELPLLSAIQYQDGWSQRHQVNLLAANRHKRPFGSVGSGIFSGNHVVYTSADSTHSKSLLLATMPKRPRELEDCELDFDVQRLNSIQLDAPEETYNYKNFSLSPEDSVLVLSEDEGKKSVCRREVCCTIDYKLSRPRPEGFENKLVLIVRDGLRKEVFSVYEQVCSLATLVKPFDPSEEGLKSIGYARETPMAFNRLTLEGNFTTEYVYPIAGYSVSELIERTNRNFQCDYQSDKQASCKLSYAGSEHKPVYSFGMFARPYERDQMPAGYPK